MPVEITEPVNLTRSIFICNLFSFFFAASKSCLLPFLTIYLRFLGLTATQTGIIIGAKTFSTFIFAPLWSKCAIQCRKRKLVLMIALFMMAVTYLPLTLLTGLSPSVESCDSHVTQQNSPPLLTTQAPVSVNRTHHLPDFSPTSQPPKLNVSASPTTIQASSTVPTKEIKNDDGDLLKAVKEILMKVGLPKEKVQPLSAEDIVQKYKLISEDESLMSTLNSMLTKTDKIILKDFLTRNGVSVRRKRDLSLKDMKETFLLKLHEKVEQAKQNLFTVVLVILIVGEAFCSPVEKIADDSWFEFLEQIDDMEKYGKHRIWSSLAYIVFPVIVTLVVDNTTCLFDLKVYPFMFHFYAFGFLLGITFLIGFFYPVPSAPKSKYKSKLGAATVRVCCTCGGLLYV